MKIPKYIDEALQKRTNAAFKFMNYDCIVSDFIEKNGIELDPMHYGLGCESLLNPDSSANAVREAILAHKNKEKKE
jgi:hypothetical protein